MKYTVKMVTRTFDVYGNECEVATKQATTCSESLADMIFTDYICEAESEKMRCQTHDETKGKPVIVSIVTEYSTKKMRKKHLSCTCRTCTSCYLSI